LKLDFWPESIISHKEAAY